MDLFFLQADTTAVQAAPKVQNLWDVLVSGGVIMIPLALLFVGAVYFCMRLAIFFMNAFPDYFILIH